MDYEAALVTAFKAITQRTGTPAPGRPVSAPEIRLLRVPGGQPRTPWGQENPQVQITHYGATREQAWALEAATSAMLSAVTPDGANLGGVFFDSARKVADAVLVEDLNPDVRPVVTVWRLTARSSVNA